MASVVHYRFKSQKSPSRITFDGTGISVFDLKREIILANKLESTADTFELRLSNPDTGEPYDADTEIIPRSSSVIARRVPAVRQGSRDSATRYVSGSLVVNAKNAARREDFKSSGSDTTSTATDSGPVRIPVGGKATEEDMLNAMFQAQGEQWQKTQQEMETKAPVYTPRNVAPMGAEKEPPPSYICHRCGQKGHYISHCPTLNDPNWETKRVRRTTGIPKSMLRTVEKPADDDSGSYLMDANGQYVVAVADDRSWQDFQKRQLQQTAKAKRQVPEELQDPITHELMVDPRKMPCCGKTYSDTSIEKALINSEFTCPNCGTEDVYIDQLVVDEEMEEKLYKFDHEDESSPPEDRKRERSDDSEEGQQSKRLKQDDDSEIKDDDGSESEDSAEEMQDGAAKPAVPPMMFPFMFPPFFMPGMVPMPNMAPVPNRTVQPYDDIDHGADFSESESSDSDDGRRSRRRRR